MFEEIKKYLPIGTVVGLKEKDTKVMIIGYLSTDDKTSIVYDYNGCIIPQGISNAQNLVRFNHEQINKFYQMGFYDEEVKLYINRLYNMNNKIDFVETDSYNDTNNISVKEKVDVSELKFDSNGIVIADGKFDIAEINELNFDENGLIISE